MIQISLDERFSLSIASEAINRLQDYLKDAGFNSESGGILLGCQQENSLDCFILDFTLPNPEDDAGPYYFVRKARPAEKLIERIWHKSNGKINYIGEWHTHNEDRPTPSSTDMALLRQAATSGASPYGFVFLIIIGNNREAFLAFTRTGERVEKIKSTYFCC
ncbi:hypothetical protein E0L17_01410 [Olsenella sp. SW781]|uniref:Mov34/MPN/PAD-1 family protein n=1 Tax=Olsenella sp. SW781 TaxID=2530046 RepID=UPI001439AFDB|nr:Mov34/MPN/PAD-1 family protein [Olsenella sp. SW781]NJE79993.1 hypothetical protein [Olsenella sp. SW781]